MVPNLVIPVQLIEHRWSTTHNIFGCYMLRPFAHPVACCCVLLGVVAQALTPVKLLNQQLPLFLLSLDRRSVAEQCWKRLLSSSNSVGVTHAHYTWSPYKVLWIVSFPRCTAGPNNVGSCCVRLHVALRSVHKSMTIILMIVQSSFHSELTNSHTFGG